MKVKFLEDYRTFKKDDEFNIELMYFPQCIVGDNGSGKSSLLQAIRGKFEKSSDWNFNVSDYKTQSKSIELSELEFTQCFGFDAYKDGGNNYMTSATASALIASRGYYANRRSHGESEFIYLNNFLNTIIPKIIPGETLIILDEFDKGFSLKNQARAYNILINLIAKHEIFVLFCTHNPFLINQSICFDLKGNFVNSKDYLLEQTGYNLIKNN